MYRKDRVWQAYAQPPSEMAAKVNFTLPLENSIMSAGLVIYGKLHDDLPSARNGSKVIPGGSKARC